MFLDQKSLGNIGKTLGKNIQKAPKKIESKNNEKHWKKKIIDVKNNNTFVGEN